MKNIYTLIIILFVFTATVKAQVSEQEFQALKAFYNATNGDNWTDRTGWENINTTATKNDVTTTWKGIDVIENGHIIGMYIDNNNLVGSLPLEIGNLTALKYLDLGSNKLNGPLPTSMVNLVNLEFICLTDNPFNCDFPTYIFTNLSKLTTAQLYNCRFGGTLGDVFATLPSLSTFDVTDNKLTGEIPSSINKLKALSEVHFDNNLFSGELPSLDSCANNMYYLTFSQNQFLGSIPETYSNFTRLQYLHLDRNQLDGIIPIGLFTASLGRLRIQDNYFTFNGIEPVFNKINALWQKSYYTDKKFPLTQNAVSFNNGETLNLNASVLSVHNLGGNNNRYKWFKNDVEVYSGNSPIYTVASAGATDAGTYRFEVTNTVVAGIILKSDNITVSIVGSNQPPTNISLSNSSISENFTGNVGTLTATDPNAGDTHSFTMATGNGTNDRDNGKFSITGNQLKINYEANFETSASLNILITANDGNGGIFTKPFVINVTNVNETPFYNGQLTSNTIDENAANGSTALTLLAEDPEGTPIVFTITAGNEDGAFGIDGNKLIVADNTKLNYDVKKQYNLSVRASDGELSTTAILIITLSKINQMPQVENATFAIDENSARGTVVGTINATDREGDPLTFSILTGNEHSTFRLNGNTIVVDNNETLNYEEYPVFNLNINVTDGISNVQSQVTINLNDVYENTENYILTFNVPGMVGDAQIDNFNHAILVTVNDVDVSALQTTFTISPNAVSNPESGITLDYSSPQDIQVTSQSGAVQVWTITVTKLVGNPTFGNQNLKIYPNPVADILHLSGLDGASIIKVFNFAGQQVLSVNTTGENEQIDISSIMQGNYLLLIESAGKHTTLKFSKQ